MYKTTILIMIGIFLSGCATTSTTYHTLRAQSSPVATAALAATEAQPIIALRNLTLPNYLSDRDIIYLQGKNQIIQAENQEWAEPLSDNLRNVIVEELRNLTKNPRVLAYPLANNIRPKYIIDVQISDFAAQKNDKQLLLGANWQITQVSNRQQVNPDGYQLNRVYPLKDDNIDTLMQGYQQAVTDLTDAINKTL